MSRRLMEFGAGSDGSSAWGCRAAAMEGARWSCSGMNRGAIAHWMSLGEGAWASGQTLTRFWVETPQRERVTTL